MSGPLSFNLVRPSEKHKYCLGFIDENRFPHLRPEIFKEWEKAVGRSEDWRATIHSALCSKHFTEQDYVVRPGALIKLLKPDAIPTVFSFNKDNKGKRKRPRTQNPDATKKDAGDCAAVVCEPVIADHEYVAKTANSSSTTKETSQMGTTESQYRNIQPKSLTTVSQHIHFKAPAQTTVSQHRTIEAASQTSELELRNNKESTPLKNINRQTQTSFSSTITEKMLRKKVKRLQMRLLRRKVKLKNSLALVKQLKDEVTNLKLNDTINSVVYLNLLNLTGNNEVNRNMDHSYARTIKTIAKDTDKQDEIEKEIEREKGIQIRKKLVKFITFKND
ncbi:THAP domain-containing protein 5-like isoform X2 [Macrosteles quadrilineatus]|uniref:THAP domain-containing protein 5-like isoform X2 n=1 Tax=Macrosteles quadrilineatus TaxID=74068 RepID=UPI0023E3264C|nr:THAP domain-containing protein 5-like isoform X2 [Macrosteles quadrilineatus]